MARSMLGAIVACLLTATVTSRAQQAAVPVSPDGYVEVGTKLYYEQCGTGTPLVLLHDGLMHSVTWNEVWPLLCAKYHVVRFDRRGYGRSEAARAPFSPEDDLLSVMRQTRVSRAVLVGSSSGAGLALDFALAHPDMTDGLVLIGPVVHGMSTSQFFAQRGSRNNAPLERDDTNAAARNWSEDRFLIDGTATGVRKKVYEALAASPQNLKVDGQFEVRPAPPAVMRLAEIQTPTLVIVGAADIADVHAYSGAIEAALPVVVREVWKDAGHLVQLEQPEALVTRIERFVTLAERREVAVPSDVLDQYVGEYKLGNGVLSISRQGEWLSLGVGGLADRRLFAASPSTFFVRTTGAELEFQKDVAGRVAGLVVRNADGSTVVCRRM